MSLVTSLAAVIGNSFYPLLAVATIWEWDNFTVCFRMCSYVATLKGQRLFKNWHMIKEMLILQYINGNELPTLPFVSETHFLLGILYFPWPSLLPPAHCKHFTLLFMLEKLEVGTAWEWKPQICAPMIWEQDLLECFAHAHYSCVGVTGR